MCNSFDLLHVSAYYECNQIISQPMSRCCTTSRKFHLGLYLFAFGDYLNFSIWLLSLLAEYMPGGSLYDYLHKNHHVLKLPQLLKFAIDVCRGMEYLHQNDIIHRDLKTANLLMDNQNVRIR